MREGVGGSVPQSWRALLEGGSVAGLEDGPLLERFVGRERDEAAEAAFAALVARHGPMVRRVCRRLLADPADADDAFQATFLILARKARAIRRPERLANWLYGTAHRASRRLRADLARRKRHESARSAPASDPDPDRSEEAAIVLEEVAGLPRDCRVAVVLCDLEGLTQEEAAARLGCSDRTLRRRLARAHELLRGRLTRRGLAPPGVAVLAIGSDPIPGAIIDATARAASRFAGGKATAGMVPASALILAEGVIEAMTWTKIKGIAVAAGCLLALGGIGGAWGVSWGRMARGQDDPARPRAESPAVARPVAAKPSPADQYRALVKRYDDRVKAYQADVVKATTDAERADIFMRSGIHPNDNLPAFVALAETYPDDPTAADALIWVLERSLSGAGGPNDPGGRAVAKAMEILARGHADDPRLGPLCPSLTLFPDGIKTDFLRTVAGRSQDRAVKGQATLALATSLRMEAALAEMFQHPEAPIAFDALLADYPDEARKQTMADPAAYRRGCEEMYSKYLPGYFKALKTADVSALGRESDRVYDRVVADFADIPAVALGGKPTRETLADVVRRQRSPAARSIPPEARFKPLAEAFKAAEKKAQAANTAAGQGEAGMKAYIAAAPRWADFGPKMWAIAESEPRSPDGFSALLWIARNHFPFFDSGEERAATLGRAVDALIRDHLDYIGSHPDDREVSQGLNGWSPVPNPHTDRVFRALFERGKSREIRGRMGLALARHQKAEADLAQSLDVRGTDPRIDSLILLPKMACCLTRMLPTSGDADGHQD